MNKFIKTTIPLTQIEHDRLKSMCEETGATQAGLIRTLIRKAQVVKLSVPPVTGKDRKCPA